MAGGSGSVGRVRVGVSRCLVGENVRYDGGHKLDPFVRDTLGRYVEFVPVCPEVECGLPVPRPAMGLVGSVGAPRLVARRDGADHTDRMAAWARRRVKELEAENLCGFIFKGGSPSCGVTQVEVYPEPGGAPGAGKGLFARAFMEHFPRLPVEEAGRLRDPVRREVFIGRLLAPTCRREVLAGAAPTASR